MRKVIVTGGLGYIGSHTVVELQNKGFEVIIIDNLSNSKIEILDRITAITNKRPLFEQLDLREKESVSRVFKTHQDNLGVIHFAASKAVGESVEQPLLYYENNISSLTYLLQEVKKLKNSHFIFSSSCTVYGRPNVLPVTEETPFKKAESPYGNTKQIGEEIIQDLCSANPKLKCISLRYFNPIGAHTTSLIGELPIGIPQNLVPFITQTAIGKREQLSVFGDNYPTPDGTCMRDYIHVVDLAEAHVVALEKLLEPSHLNNYEVFNIGTGQGHSVLEVISSFEKVSNQKLNYKIASRRAGDIDCIFADTNKANTVLGWKAKHNLDQAMHSAWKWENALTKNKV